MDEISKIWPGWQIVETLKESLNGSVYKIEKKNGKNIDYAVAKVLYYPSDDPELETLATAGMYVPFIQNQFKEKVQEITDRIQKIKDLRARHIVSIEEYKMVENQDAFGWIIYIRMELLKNLDVYLKEKGSLSEEETAKLGLDICSALKACEKNGIVHGDIKTANIYVTRYGSFKLGNFEFLKQKEGISETHILGSMLYKMRNDGRANANGDLLEILKKASYMQWNECYTHAADLEKDLKEWKQKKEEDRKKEAVKTAVKTAVKNQEPPKMEPKKTEPKKADSPKVEPKKTVPTKTVLPNNKKKKGSFFWKILICLGIAAIIGRQLDKAEEKKLAEKENKIAEVANQMPEAEETVDSEEEMLWRGVYDNFMNTLAESEYDFLNLNSDSLISFLIEQEFVFSSNQCIVGEDGEQVFGTADVNPIFVAENVEPAYIDEQHGYQNYEAYTKEDWQKSEQSPDEFSSPEVRITNVNDGEPYVQFKWEPKLYSEAYQRACPLIGNYNNFSDFCERFGITEEMLENLENTGDGWYRYKGECIKVSFKKEDTEQEATQGTDLWIDFKFYYNGESEYRSITFYYTRSGCFWMTIY